jgi:DNA-directed RNA polymerase subunit RPC12/RpoP
MFRKWMKKKSQKSLRFFAIFSGRCPPKSSNVIAIPAPQIPISVTHFSGKRYLPVKITNRKKMSAIFSYSLSNREHVPKQSTVKKRKRKPVVLQHNNLKSYKYKCYECRADVYLIPGHDLCCVSCSSRIVEKTGDCQVKRTVSAR